MGISHREQFDKVFFLDKYKHDEGILELHKQMLKLEVRLINMFFVNNMWLNINNIKTFTFLSTLLHKSAW